MTTSRPVAIVAGAASELGRYLTGYLRADGWLVAAIDRAAPDLGEDLAFSINDGDEAGMTAAVNDTVTHLGIPTLLVTANDAPAPAAFTDVDAHGWGHLLGDVVGRPLDASRAVVPVMRQHRLGTIIAVSPAPPRGDAAVVGAHYAAAQATVIGTMRSLALEVADDNIRVMCIAPEITADRSAAMSADSGGADYAAVGQSVTYLLREGGFSTGQVMTPHLEVSPA